MPDETDPAPDTTDDTTEVTRSVEVDAGIDEVWHAVADPTERATWLDDPDALTRRVREDDRVAGRRLVWTWWHPGDEGGASTVSVVLRPVDGGGTRVVVTESRPALPPVFASARGPGARVLAAPLAGGMRPSPSWIRCALDRWDARLLGLELRFVAARAGVV
jgi:uncharacterized protein YndB with AHSA1/START domain